MCEEQSHYNMIEPFPLVDAQIYIKTVPFSMNAIENLDLLKQSLL